MPFYERKILPLPGTVKLRKIGFTEVTECLFMGDFEHLR